jgi:hypothetical protein
MTDLLGGSGDPTALGSRLKDLATNQYFGAGQRAAEHALANSFWEVVHRSLTATAAVFAAVSGGSILSDAKGGWRTVAGICALLAAVLSTADTSTKAGDLAQGHKQALDGFTSLRTQWLTFRDFTAQSALAPDELTQQFNDMVRQRDELSAKVPVPPQWAKTKVESRRKKS